MVDKPGRGGPIESGFNFPPVGIGGLGQLCNFIAEWDYGEKCFPLGSGRLRRRLVSTDYADYTETTKSVRSV